MYWYNTVKRLEIFPELEEKKYKQKDYDQLHEYEVIKEYMKRVKKIEDQNTDKLTYLFIQVNCERFRPKYRS